MSDNLNTTSNDLEPNFSPIHNNHSLYPCKEREPSPLTMSNFKTSRQIDHLLSFQPTNINNNLSNNREISSNLSYPSVSNEKMEIITKYRNGQDAFLTLKAVYRNIDEKYAELQKKSQSTNMTFTAIMGSHHTQDRGSSKRIEGIFGVFVMINFFFISNLYFFSPEFFLLKYIEFF